MHLLLNLLIKASLLAAGLVFAAALVLAFVLLLVVWSLRVGWARLTGRPVTPFVMRMYPGDAFASMYRGAQQPAGTPRADAVRPTRRASDVSDVEVRDIR
jgi:hypothetical protein